MSRVLVAQFAPDLDLPDGYIIEWLAVDPTTGANIAGVKVTGVSLFGTMLGSGQTALTDLGPLMLVPGPGA